MKKTPGTKSSFHKLYLIDSEMYNRILPYLNEIDKQELNDLNQNNHPYDDLKDDGEGQTTEQQAINDNSDITPQYTNTTNKSTQNDKAPELKTKKFACEICVNKKFTTKPSLKRHHKTFHEKKQSLKEEEIHPEINSPPLPEKTTLIDEPPSKPLKRKFHDDSETLDKDEPAFKQAKYSESPESPDIQERKGIKRKPPVRGSDNMSRKRFHWESF